MPNVTIININIGPLWWVRGTDKEDSGACVIAIALLIPLTVDNKSCLRTYGVPYMNPTIAAISLTKSGSGEYSSTNHSLTRLFSWDLYIIKKLILIKSCFVLYYLLTITTYLSLSKEFYLLSECFNRYFFRKVNI